MASYLIRRVIFILVSMVVMSALAFILIQLPPGDWLTTYIARLQAEGNAVDDSLAEALRFQYGLDKPLPLQYFIWVGKLLRGDLGFSYAYQKPVKDLIGERLILTMTISILSIIFTYIVAIPIGIYSATHQYSASDFIFTFIGFIGLSVPNFLLALIIMFFFFNVLDMSVGGLFSQQYAIAPWSWPRVWDMIKHLWTPIIIIGAAGTAGLIRVMRATMLDELNKQYVITARSKGVKENKLLFKYPVRIAINPIISTIGYLLPFIVSGATLISIVLSMPTVGPLLLTALRGQDMSLAGSLVMFLGFLTILGTLISDILLAVADPRIRFE